MSNKASFAAQSPEVEDLDESVDDILDNVNKFIEGVYRDLRMTPSPSVNRDISSNRNITCTPRRLESACPNLTSTSPRGASGGTLSPILFLNSSSDSGNCGSVATSPARRRNLDAEIERINRMCENVDQNLRLIGVFKNNDTNEQNIRTSVESGIQSIESSPTATTAISTLTLNSPSVTTNASPQLPCVPSLQVIDLSETQTQTPDVSRQPNDLNSYDDEDDDVIIVSDNIIPVVNLCTPGGDHEEANPRRTIDWSQFSRRRLEEEEDEYVFGPTIAQRRRTEYENDFQHLEDSAFRSTAIQKQRIENLKKKSPIKTSHAKTPNKTIQNNQQSSTGTGPTPFMCAVCMESCLQRKPTSTKCGHVFCQECIRHAIRLSHKCPLCNTKISHSSIFRIYL